MNESVFGVAVAASPSHDTKARRTTINAHVHLTDAPRTHACTRNHANLCTIRHDDNDAAPSVAVVVVVAGSNRTQIFSRMRHAPRTASN